MSNITINKNNKSITFIHNNIAFSQFGIADEILDLITDLQDQLQQKENIIKEAREKIRYWQQDYMNTYISTDELDDILEILDKGE